MLPPRPRNATQPSLHVRLLRQHPEKLGTRAATVDSHQQAALPFRQHAGRRRISRATNSRGATHSLSVGYGHGSQSGPGAVVRPALALRPMAGIMHARELVELSALVAAHGPLLIGQEASLPPHGIEQYWVASKSRLDRWNRTLKGLTVKALGCRGAADRLLVRGVCEEILTGEVLTRVWSAVLGGLRSPAGERTSPSRSPAAYSSDTLKRGTACSRCWSPDRASTPKRPSSSTGFAAAAAALDRLARGSLGPTVRRERVRH